MATFHWEQEDAWFEACALIWNSELGWMFLPAPTLCLTDVSWLLMLHVTLFCLNTILLWFQLVPRAINFCISCQWGIFTWRQLLNVSTWEKAESFVIGAERFVQRRTLLPTTWVSLSLHFERIMSLRLQALKHRAKEVLECAMKAAGSQNVGKKLLQSSVPLAEEGGQNAQRAYNAWFIYKG